MSRILLALALSGCAKQPFITPTALSESLEDTVQPWEDGMRTRGSAGTVEWWYFDAHLEDGTVIVANFMTKPIMKRGKPLTPKMEITITEPDGTTHQSFKLLDPKAFSASSDKCQVSLGGSYVAGNLETYSVHLEAEDMRVDMVLDREVASWRPGSGKVYFDAKQSRYLGWVVPVPHGNVAARVQIGDRLWVSQGTGYHDHNWANTPLNKHLDSWYWGRGHVDTYTTLFFVGTGSRRWGHTPLNLFMLAEGPTLLMDDPDFFQFKDAEGVLTLEAHQADLTFSMFLHDPVLLESEDLLDGVPFPSLVGLFMQPYYYRYQAPTVMEGAHSVSGQTIYEVMLFR